MAAGSRTTDDSLLLGCNRTVRRRTFLQQLGALAIVQQAPAIITSDRQRPVIDAGVAAGLYDDDAIIWAHVDRPSQMIVEFSTTSAFTSVRRVRGSAATAETGLTARAQIDDFPPGQDIFYRVRFEDGRAVSDSVTGRFKSAPEVAGPVRIAWSADVV